MISQSIPVTIIAVAWNIFAIVMVMFPADTNPTSDTMNYTVAVGGGWIGLCVIYFYFPKYGGVHWFTGPISTIDPDLRVSRAETVTEPESKEEDSSLHESEPQ